MNKIKYVPNALGIIRILFCLSIIFLTPFGLLSMIIYIAAGMTDMVDGPIARHFKATSESGAIIDSVADMVFVFVGFIILLPVMGLWGWLLLGMYIALAYKVASGFVGYLKHKEMVLLHTYSNKFLAVLLFSIPIIYFIIAVCFTVPGARLFVNICTLVGMISIIVITTEEILINLLLTKPNRDIQSIFQVKAINEALLKKEQNN